MKKIALITGASSGIGKEFCHLHAERGGDLIVVARRKEKLVKLQSELEKTHGSKVVVIAKDLTLPEAPQEIYKEIQTAGLEVDYLINNAGFGMRGLFHEISLDTHVNMINLNVTALTVLTHLFLPDFVKKSGGKILNVSSTAALVPGPLQAVYYATKAYVTSFSNAIAKEYENHNITITALMPGATESEFAQISGMNKTTLFNKPTSAREVAEEGYNGMIEGRLDVISGVSFTQKLMSLALPITPKKVILDQIYQMQKVDN